VWQRRGKYAPRGKSSCRHFCNNYHCISTHALYLVTIAQASGNYCPIGLRRCTCVDTVRLRAEFMSIGAVRTLAGGAWSFLD